MTETISMRLLNGEPSEMEEFQRVLEEAPTYAHRTMGVPVGPTQAQSIFSFLPDGKSYDDKFLFGVYLGNEVVGCADVIRNYPTDGTATIGLLLISEKRQGRQIGRRTYATLENNHRDTARLQYDPYRHRKGERHCGSILDQGSASSLLEKGVPIAAAASYPKP